MKKVLFLIAALAFSGSIFAQYEPYWEDINHHQFGNHDPFVARVELDDHLITPDDNYAAYEVAAFVTVNGTEYYRGHGFMKYYPEYGDTIPVLEYEIFYKPLDNDNEQPLPVHFKLYDHNTEILYDYWASDIEFETQTMYNDYNPSTMATLSFYTTTTKDIAAYSGDGGYVLITSPLNAVASPEEVLNMTLNEYDLYAFDQNAEDGLEWRNYKAGSFENLQPGTGYLYANSQDVTLTFVGPRYNGDGKVTLYKKTGDNVEFSGWNLVGNPFNEDAYIDRPFYRINEDGSDIMSESSTGVIERMEGVFVIANSDEEEMTFSTTPNQGKKQIVLNVAQERGTIDRAIVRFGQNETLPKFMLNESHTKMYIPKDNKDFAVVPGSNNGRLPVNFEPAEDGTYFFNVDVENVRVQYLHLIDREMGMDVDLLQNPTYKFEAKANEKPNRFELVFKTGSNQFKELFTSDGGSNFSFCNNGNWIINNEGDAVLQVIDVNGRILCNEEINGSVSKRIDAAPGVYMLRLINNNDVKVQKIVVE
ncbi:MAG: T9SS type A sorting domain-containing protein [Bacteroidales bacterium]|nr:T9SS type A sorting domain-containing protein [Bacteroidales bacterium]